MIIIIIIINKLSPFCNNQKFYPAMKPNQNVLVEKYWNDLGHENVKPISEKQQKSIADNIAWYYLKNYILKIILNKSHSMYFKRK